MSPLGQKMRVLEVLGIVMYFGPILMALNYTTNWITLKGNQGGKLFTTEPECLQLTSKYKQMAGNTMEWFEIELMIFLFYTMTMLFLLAKSRFSKVGVDQSG